MCFFCCARTGPCSRANENKNGQTLMRGVRSRARLSKLTASKHDPWSACKSRPLIFHLRPIRRKPETLHLAADDGTEYPAGCLSAAVHIMPSKLVSRALAALFHHDQEGVLIHIGHVATCDRREVYVLLPPYYGDKRYFAVCGSHDKGRVACRWFPGTGVASMAYLVVDLSASRVRYMLPLPITYCLTVLQYVVHSNR